MSCYHPNFLIPSGQINLDTGKPIYSFHRPSSRKDHFLSQLKDYNGILIPCGKCIGCRLDYSRSWADRMMLELETCKKAIFVTLTYDNDHVPIKCDEFGSVIGFTVSIRDCQLFLKRLRRQYEDVRIRFYLSSEYGPKTFRPHYHAIIFGLSLDDFPSRLLKGKNELHQQYYLVPELSSIWSNGFVLCSEVSYETCAYVARYVLKKVRDDPFWSKDAGVDPEFNLMSRRPGLGAEYLDLHPDCLDFSSIYISTSSGSKKLSIPKYFLRRLELTDPVKSALIKESRKQLADDKVLLKLSQTSLSYLDQLEVEESCKLRSIKALKRGDL